MIKTLLRIFVSIVAILALIFAVAYIDGSALPVHHVASVSGIVDASPEKVFALITDVAAAPTWRKEVLSVKVLPPDNGHDHWIEELGHGTTMDFVATATRPYNMMSGSARREVTLADPQYGGTWIYEVGVGPGANQTTLKITETGYIHPPVYRFMMKHIFGTTYNLDNYLRQIKVAAPGR